MSRSTIDFGIDLGTTNSAVAVVGNAGIQIIRNPEGHETTPSAVWVKESGQVNVGRSARDRARVDSGNACTEFKLQMGASDVSYRFADANRVMTPPELSSLVLRALKETAEKSSRQRIDAAAITVPAAFEVPQCEATKAAAELAGFVQSPILQEPIAAALAYGYDEAPGKRIWAVFDMGGGTFDAAVVAMREGVLSVLNHGGDNHLGGKSIDWAIVDKILIPFLKRSFSLNDLDRGNPKWHESLARLKVLAEEAKVRLSTSANTKVAVGSLCHDNNGTNVEFELDISRAQLDSVAEPFITRAVNIARSVLEEERLSPEDIEQVILVGGPTLMPSLRERLLDPDEGLGIKLAEGVDPLTVVARGAAHFAGTVKKAPSSRPKIGPRRGRCKLHLDYTTVGVSRKPVVGGRLELPDEESPAGHEIEVSANAPGHTWKSERVHVNQSGTFVTRLAADQGEVNHFTIALFDAEGNQRSVEPDRIQYVIGTTINDPPLTASIGVAMANNEVDVFFDKGTPLPAEKTIYHITAFAARPKMAESFLKIPIMEGESPRANRNRLIGSIEIPSEHIDREVPRGSSVQIHLRITTDRTCTARAFVPLLDRWFESVGKFGTVSVDPDILRRDFDNAKARLEEAKGKAQEIENGAALKIVSKIEAEQLLEEIEHLLPAAATDRDTQDKAVTRLLALEKYIDQVEDLNEWPGLLHAAREAVERLNDVVQEEPPAERSKANKLAGRIDELIASEDAFFLEKEVDAAVSFRINILFERPDFLLDYIEYLSTQLDEMTNKNRAQALLSRAHGLKDSKDVGALQAIVDELHDLLPDNESNGGKESRIKAWTLATAARS